MKKIAMILLALLLVGCGGSEAQDTEDDIDTSFDAGTEGEVGDSEETDGEDIYIFYDQFVAGDSAADIMSMISPEVEMPITVEKLDLLSSSFIVPFRYYENEDATELTDVELTVTTLSDMINQETHTQIYGSDITFDTSKGVTSMRLINDGVSTFQDAFEQNTWYLELTCPLIETLESAEELQAFIGEYAPSNIYLNTSVYAASLLDENREVIKSEEGYNLHYVVAYEFNEYVVAFSVMECIDAGNELGYFEASTVRYYPTNYWNTIVKDWGLEQK
ncbi:MAG: hypothetical protein R3Y57_01295 [Erysipelotrichaceae bacterium]